MIPAELKRLAGDADLDAENRFGLRIAFGLACIERVEHLLTDPDVIAALSQGKNFITGERDRQALQEAAASAATAARSHAGSNSLDGAGSAAVSTSHGVAAALAGRALEAAEYAAYAGVYSYASHAVTDLSAYAEEHRWQINKLSELIERFDAAD